MKVNTALGFVLAGVSLHLLRAAVDYARSQGAHIIEGYPVEPDQSYRFMGAPSIFEQAGFHEAAMMCQSAFKFVYPNQHLSFKYTTVNGVNAF